MFYATSLTLIALFHIITTISAAPVLLPRITQSASYSSLAKPILSPYYLYFGNQNTATLQDAFDSVGMRAATVAFGSAPKGSCSLTTDMANIVPQAQAFIAKGGAIAVGFVGNLQDQTDPRQHIQQACTDVPSLTKLIENSMKQFGTHNIEFDIEDDTLLSDTAASARLAQALVQVKKDFPDTYVTYTVGADSSGMPPQQVAYVQAAKDNGLTIDGLTLMTMNFGGTDNVGDSKTAITGGASQLANIYGISNPAALNKMGMLPAIGVDNDQQVIDLAGMMTLAQFVKQNNLAQLSYWSFNRDFPGDAGATTQSLDDSSSPDQKNPYDFFTMSQNALKA